MPPFPHAGEIGGIMFSRFWQFVRRLANKAIGRTPQDSRAITESSTLKATSIRELFGPPNPLPASEAPPMEKEREVTPALPQSPTASSKRLITMVSTEVLRDKSLTSEQQIEKLSEQIWQNFLKFKEKEAEAKKHLVEEVLRKKE